MTTADTGDLARGVLALLTNNGRAAGIQQMSPRHKPTVITSRGDLVIRPMTTTWPHVMDEIRQARIWADEYTDPDEHPSCATVREAAGGELIVCLGLNDLLRLLRNAEIRAQDA